MGAAKAAKKKAEEEKKAAETVETTETEVVKKPTTDDKASSSSSSSSEERVFADDAWNNHIEPAGTSICVAGIIFLLLSAGAIVLCILSYATDDFQRIDEYHPSYLTLSQRHFDGIKDPFMIWERNKNYTCTFLTRLRENDALSAWHAEEEKAGRPIITYPYCSFHVPYTSVWGAMASSLFGLAAVCAYAHSVMSHPRGTDEMHDIANKIHISALDFLNQEYTWLAPFVLLLWCFLYIAIDGQDHSWVPASSVSFLFGAFLSASCGYMGMHLATQGNCRTAAACFSSRTDGLEEGLAVAFRTGACMGLGVVSCGVLGLTLSYAIFGNVQSLGGFGFGASAVALFARVGGGIYTKAADVGADLCGKVDHSLAEDSPKNPATIADCVGDNVGDVAGMGADLFESYVGAIVAAAVLGAGEFGEKGVALPFYIAMIGLVVSIFGTLAIKVSKDENGKASLDALLAAMRLNILVSGLLIVGGCVILCVFLFRAERDELEDLYDTPWRQKEPGARLLGCIVVGLVVGILIGLATEYFTSHTDEPTQSIGRATEFGPGPVIIQGLGQGMYSTVIPLVLIVAAVLGAYYLAGFYGTAVACVGMLSTLGVTMSTDAYGPVSDNAGGIAEMAELPSWVRDYTDQLDALGNTTAATGKGFANGSAVLSALSLLIAFSRVAEIESVDLLKPVVVIGVLIGSCLPYVFGAMTMLSVNKAAQEMMFEVRRQFKANPKLLTDKDSRPDYKKCIEISCKSSLREMVLPGVLATFSPLVVGFIFGSHALVGLLVGAIASGYLQGVMMSNTGGAWDNAKKWIEAGSFELKGEVQGKGTDCHKAAVCGDTVGDPFKDTSGPALNILIKLMTRFAFVCAPLFADDWEYWWVGLILLGGAIVLVIILKFTLLKETPVKEEEETPGAPDAE
eukprot:TRINITY_DN16_c0_g1_i7.p1 TRINITY_DN16_c0_g1~~TRINITY_DN16_c0_g1_i7.p1  ORF type:complete len:909 (+),score=238.50 TRINITY_DN16_c0_g1_i7:48-2774(+)